MSMKMTMKKINFLIIALIAGVAFSGCLKDNDIEPYDVQKYLDLEKPILKAYVEGTPELEGAILDAETGIWYKVIEQGLQDKESSDFYTYKVDANNILIYPDIRVLYDGKLVATGVSYDKPNEVKDMSLANLISGWQIAFFPNKIKDKAGKINEFWGLTELGLQKGSRIRIIMPSPYGYQNQPKGSIPANSPLDFYIEVLEVKAPSSTNN